MSSEQNENGSRKALGQEEDRKLLHILQVKTEENFKPWLLDKENMETVNKASDEVQQAAEKKWNKYYPNEKMPTLAEPNVIPKFEDENKAPAFIKELSKSEMPKPPESQDVIYLSEQEVALGTRVNTLTEMLVHDPDLPDSHAGPWIERCVGRDPETKKLKVVRMKARWVQIEPWMVIAYLGNVVQDHMSVHTANVSYKKQRHGYVFDRFYVDPRNGKRYDRCCLVLDKIHQASLMYEKLVSKRTRKRFSAIKQIRGPLGKATGNPMYKVIGANETDYRDLKRIFDRHFLFGPNEELADDIGLKLLINA